MLYKSNAYSPREVKQSPNARVAECLIESIFLVPKKTAVERRELIAKIGRRHAVVAICGIWEKSSSLMENDGYSEERIVSSWWAGMYPNAH